MTVSHFAKNIFPSMGRVDGGGSRGTSSSSANDESDPRMGDREPVGGASDSNGLYDFDCRLRMKDEVSSHRF